MNKKTQENSFFISYCIVIRYSSSIGIRHIGIFGYISRDGKIDLENLFKRDFSRSPVRYSSDSSDDEMDYAASYDPRPSDSLSREKNIYFDVYSSLYGGNYQNDWFNLTLDNKRLDEIYTVYGRSINNSDDRELITVNRIKVIHEYKQDGLNILSELQELTHKDIKQDKLLNEVNKWINNIHEQLPNIWLIKLKMRD